MAARRTKKITTTSSYKFPCGLVANNRLVKAPMYEHLADFLGGPPNAYHYALYSSWSRHGWGMIITGNVQVTPSHLTLGRDMVVPSQLDERTIQPYKTLAKAMKGPGGRTLAIMQLSHAGRQSANFIGGRYPFKRPLAPSAIAVGSHVDQDDPIAALLQSVLFQTPREMSSADIDEVVEGFIKGARLASESGFDGVELHVAHGYLLAQFLSPKSNRRRDEYSLRSENGLRLLLRIVDGIRAAVPSQFILGVKLNASDYLIDAPTKEHNRPLHSSETRALQHIVALANWCKIDFIDITGGDYENPEFLTSEPGKRGRRQAFFARFSQEALKILNSPNYKLPSRPAIILTGGLRTPNILLSALGFSQADFLGIGRCSAVCPQIPEIMLEYDQGRTDGGDVPFGPEPDLSTPKFLEIWPLASVWSSLKKVKLMGAGLNMAWHTIALRQLALVEFQRSNDPSSSPIVFQGPDYKIGGFQALIYMFLWVSDTQRSVVSSGLLFVLLMVTLLSIYLYIN